MTAAAAAVFWASLALVLYVYLGYPLLLLVLARLRPRPVRRGEVFPAVTIVVPAYNEEGVIEEKVRNCLALDYPPGRLAVLVASDGSSDGTVERARRTRDPRVEVLDLPRQGKARTLNAAVERARGEVLVFTDANALLEPRSLRRLVEPYADPEVGGVGGNRRYRRGRGGDATAQGEGLYWRWDKWQKGLESRIGSAFASDGTLHSVRRELYAPIADVGQSDDIAISARVVLQGRRLLFEPLAVAWEEEPVEGREEFRRKVRVTMRSVLALLHLRGALVTRGFYSLELLSHKLVRHLVAPFLLLLLASSAALAARHPLYAGALAAQLGFYALALAGLVLRHRPAGRSRLLAVPYYFCLVNAAAFAGTLLILRGERARGWSPRGGLERPPEGR